MLNRIIEILSAHTEYPASKMTAETRLSADLGLNSYDVISIITEFEDKFDVEIPDKDIKKLQTIGDAAAYIESK